MSSKITNAHVFECIKELRAGSKARKFTQTVELQISLKDYDPQKDKRFVGTVRLPNIPRPNLKLCLIADQKHADEAKAAGLEIEVTSLDSLKKFNKDKKLVKRWAKKYSLLLATDTLIKKIHDVKASVKWQLKKVTNLNVAAGNETMTD